MGKQAYNPRRVIDQARRLLADAATRCQAPDRESEDNIHEIRKDLKHVRAYWRLMRYALGQRHSKAGNARCKQAAKQLSDARDHVVMLGTLDDLGQDSGAKTAMAFGQARQAMHETVNGSPTQGIDWDKVADLIRNDDAAWSGLDPASIDPADIKRGWKRTRQKARKGYAHSKKYLNPEALHDWRKWTKRWLQQEELLHPDKQQRIERLDELGELLGRHHDMIVLTERLGDRGRLDFKPRRRVKRLIRKRCIGLEKQAVKLGHKAFA